MSVKVIAQKHPLKNDKIQIETSPKSISEILKEIDSGFPEPQARVCRNGEIVKDFSTLAADGDTVWVKYAPFGDSPQSTGGAMKGGGLFLTMVGIAVALIPGGLAVGVALIGTGLSMALGGAVLLNADIPKFKDKEKPESDPSIRGAKNQARPYGRIPVLFGEHRVYPDIAANPYTEITGSQQFLVQLFCGGYKDCAIDLDSIKLGETKLTDLSQTKDINKIIAGGDPVFKLEILQNGGASKIYPRCVHEDVINAPLQNQIEDADGNKISGEITRDTPANTSEINIDVFAQSIGRYNDKGDLLETSVEIKAWYKLIDDAAYKLIGTLVISGAELKTKREQITINVPAEQYSVKIERVTADNADSKITDQVYVGSIRSVKYAPPVNPEKQKDLTIIALRVMATAKLNNIIDSFNYVAVSKLPVYTPGGSGPLYWLNTAETSNPASMLYYALLGRAAQQKADADAIDWQSLEEFYTWCEKHNYTCNAYLSESVTIAEMLRMIGSTARADILRIDSKISVVQDIERSSPVQLFTPKNTVAYSVTMFNADIPDAIALRYIDKNSGFTHNEVKVYNTPDGNPPDEKTPDTIQKVDLWGITDDAQARRIGMYNYACIKNRPFVHTIEVDIEYLLCDKGDWIQYAGDIALTGSVQGRIKGVIFADGVCVGIDTDEPVEMTAGNQYAVRIRLKDGTITLKEAVFNPGLRREKSAVYYPSENDDLYEPFAGEMFVIDEKDNVYYEPQNVILFTEPLDANILKAGNIYAFGIRGYEALNLKITDIQPGQNLSAVLTCVEYAPEIFGVDDPNFILPDFENRITPVSGAVDSGVVNPDNWMSFNVFHDSEEEPPRPAGSGQTDGWHRAQTFRSVWQSSKVAESVESGGWGLPVRIRAERGTDDLTPVWLSLSPQNITLDTDGDGNVLAELLPLTVQARLFKWNSVLSDVLFSLVNAPNGISIDENGLVIINTDAALNDVNNITVRSEYQNGVYTSTLSIIKNFNNSAPRYLGTINTLDISEATVMIIKGPVQGQTKARQGDYVLAVAVIGNRNAGSVFQWTGIAWEYRSPNNFSDLYMRCFKDGLDVPELIQDIAWFGAVFAKLLVAMNAFIETLEAQKITLKNGGVIQSDNYNPSRRTGWLIDYLGNAYFNSGLIGGVDINANSLTVNGKGYLPIGFVYFQIKGQPAPQEIFAGVWEDISSQYAGLFFRVEGGNAAPFGQNQEQSIQSHRHEQAYIKSKEYSVNTRHSFDRFESGSRERPLTDVTLSYTEPPPSGLYYTENTGSKETRPENTTIRVWKRKS
ncbi:MAG: host specificity factor TipJ family phage tail protein [Treponema sp.]|nr:host specificity factor TipJ family phage tail protein [Treponema sp.]